MIESVVKFIICCVALPDEFADEFELVTENCYETSFSPVTQSDFLSDCQIALVNYCETYYNDNKLYDFIMSHLTDYEVEVQ